MILLPETAADLENFITYNAPNLRLNGLEIVIGLPLLRDEQVIFDTLVKHSLINWKIIQVKQSYAEALNQCILLCEKKIVAIVGTPTLFDFGYLYMAFRMLNLYSSAFLVFGVDKTILNGYNFDCPHVLFVKRHDLNQSMVSVGIPFRKLVLTGIVRSLQRLGLKRIYHPHKSSQSGAVSMIDIKKNVWKKILFPGGKEEPLASTSKPPPLLYDWSKASFGETRCRQYLKNFKKSQVMDKYCFDKEYRVIALIQTYNEIKNVPEVLYHLDNFCDGIILLDDDSNDDTYEQAISKKLLLKVQKARHSFDDLTNRNILLDLVSFFSVEWIYTLDADERFDERYNKIYDLLTLPYNMLSFHYVHLWGDKSTYRTDYETSPSKNGIFTRARMFKNIGRSQIYPQDNRRLHFNPVPFIQNHSIVSILILHYGTLTEQHRNKKYEFYVAEDSTVRHHETIYKFLKDSEVRLNDVKNIVLGNKSMSFE